MRTDAQRGAWSMLAIGGDRLRRSNDDTCAFTGPTPHSALEADLRR